MRLNKLLLVALTIGSLCSCDSNGGSKGETPQGDPGVVYIDIINKGYGTAFIDALAEAFEAKTGIHVEKTISGDNSSQITKLESGSTKTDIFFTLNTPFDYAYTPFTIGTNTYDCLLADLTDVYNSKASDIETVNIADKMYESYRKYNSIEKNGETKYYSMPWISGMTGILINKNLWNDSWVMPRTTNELLTLCEQIKTDGKTPFIYCLEDSYWSCLTDIWAAQYEGEEDLAWYEKGYTSGGKKQYVPEIMTTHLGFYEAIKFMEQLIDNKNMHAYSKSLDFTSVQNVFLEGDDGIVMNPNGDWIQREMEENYTAEELDIEFMRFPVISALGTKLGISEETLNEIIDYVDGNLATEPTFTSSVGLDNQKVIEDVRFARSLTPTLSFVHTCYIPSYSQEIDEAKQFLKFMASDEGQSVFVKGSKGYTLPYHYDYTKDINYNCMSAFTKSCYQMMANSNVYQINAKDRIFTMGHLNSPGRNLDEYIKFLAATGNDHKTADKIFLDDYNYVKERWSTIKSQGGIR